MASFGLLSSQSAASSKPQAVICRQAAVLKTALRCARLPWSVPLSGRAATAGVSTSATAADVDASIEELLRAAAAVEPTFAERKRVQHSLVAPQVGQHVTGDWEVGYFVGVAMGASYRCEDAACRAFHTSKWVPLETCSSLAHINNSIYDLYVPRKPCAGPLTTTTTTTTD
jgi:hypothetical protein